MTPYAAPDRLLKLTVEITTLCNLKCAGCPRTTAIEQGAWSDLHMDLDLFGRILENLPPVGFVTLHGIGEPTLHTQFNELVVMARASGKFKRMKMTTNALARTVEYYAKSVAAGLPVHVSMVVSALNYRDIPYTLAQLYRMGKPPVHMQEYQDYGNPYGLMSQDQRAEFLQRMAVVLPSLEGMTIVPPNYAKPQGDICTAPWYRPAITVQGYLTPCCTTFDPSHFGHLNLGEMSFAEIWRQPSLQQWIDRFLRDETEICRGCSLNPRGFGMDNLLGRSGKTGAELHVIKVQQT